MPPKLISHNVDSIAIAQRLDDGYVNLTAMAKANNKLIADYLRLDSTKAFLEELSVTMGYPIVKIVQVKTGKYGGTWGHPLVAINCGQWCSPAFAVLVSQWVFEWMSQSVTKAQWQQVRIEGKATRRSLTDAIADYIQRHSNELSENDKRWLFTNASQQVDLIVFGRVAKKLAEDLEVPRENLRDSFTSDELQLVREVENTAMRIIDRDDIHPLEAVRQMGTRLAIPVQMRGIKGKLEE